MQYNTRRDRYDVAVRPAGSSDFEDIATGVSAGELVAVSMQWCPLGFYLSESNCVACPAGFTTTTAGSMNADDCAACPAGSYLRTQPYAPVCALCERGTYSTTSGVVGSCTACPEGTTNGVRGGSDPNECATCPTNYALSEGLCVVTFTDATEAGVGGQLGQGGSGAMFADLDSDNDLDLCVTNKGNKDDMLYRNDGDARFTDLTFSAGLGGLSTGRGIIAGNLNDDAHLDIYIANGGDDGNQPNQLYINDGAWHFEELAAESGAEALGQGEGLIIGDMDGDGDLDIYVGNREMANVLLVNDGTGNFTNITIAANAGGENHASKSMCIADVDGDSNLDIFLVGGESSENQKSANLLLMNQGGLDFLEQGVARGVSEKDVFGNGCAVGDVDSDMDLDIFVTGYEGYNLLLENNGSGYFTDAAHNAGVQGQTHQYNAGVLITDFDADGDLDIFVTHDKNSLFLNDGLGSFQERGLAAGITGRNEERATGIICGDVDSDGDPDLFVSIPNVNTANKLLLNNHNQPSDWLIVRPLDYNARFTFHGATVRVLVAGTSTIVSVGLVDGGGKLFSQSSYDVHFGLRGKRTGMR